MTARRFPPPWSVEDIGADVQRAAFVVTDSTGQKLAYVYFEDEPGRRSANSASSLHWPHVIDANAILRGEPLSPSRPLHEAPVAADVVNELGLPPAAVVGAASRFTEANLHPLAFHKTHRLFLLLGTVRVMDRTRVRPPHSEPTLIVGSDFVLPVRRRS
jgi:hypothetical protein